MGIYKMGDAFSPSAGEAQNEPLSRWERGGGEG